METSSGWLTAPCLPLPLRTRGPATLPRYPLPCGDCGGGGEPPKLTARLLTDVSAGMAATPLGGPVASPSASPLVPEGQSCWGPGPQDHADSLREPLPHATSTALPAARRPASPPASPVRPSVRPSRVLAAPLQRRAVCLRTSSGTPGQSGGQKGSPSTPDA